MVKDILIKRLLTQGGVSVLAGLLMSSAVLAGDMSEPVSEPEVAAEAVRDTKDAIEAFEPSVENFEPEVHIDPMPEPPPEGVEFDGAFPETFEPTVENIEPEVHIDPMPEPAPETGGGDPIPENMFETGGGDPIPEDLIDYLGNDGLADGDGDSMPEAARNAVEFEGMIAQSGNPDGRDISRAVDSDKDPSAGSNGNSGTYQRMIVK